MRIGYADLHMHTTASDGSASPRQMLDAVARRGDLDVIAITDHDHIDSSLWAHSQRDQYPFEIVPGMEVTTAEGHVLALWVTELIPAGLSLGETTAAIHVQDGIAILAHPLEPTIAPQAAWRYFRHPQVLIQANLDGVESFNAGAVTPGCNWLASRVFRPVDLPVVGSSDAHMPGSIGSGRTCFPGQTAADLRAALVNRQTTAEGTPWSITDYLKLSIIFIQRRRTASLAARATSTHPTHL